MHVSGLPFDLNWFLQFIGTAFVVALGLLHLVKNTAPGDSTRLPAIPVPCVVIPRRSSAPDANWSDIVGRSATSSPPRAMFKSFWGSQEQEAQPHPQEIPTNSWNPPSLLSSPSSSRPTTPSSSSSSSFNLQRAGDRPQTPSHVSPSEAAGIIVLLKDKSIDELRKLLADKDAYHRFFLSLDQVKAQNNLKDELRKETLQLAGENLEKEPQIMELRNQCRIIRTTELAAAQEKLHELERQKEETLKFYSPASLLHRLQEAMNETDEESEALHRQLLDKEIDVGAFLQKYKKLRNAYHRRALTHLAAKMSLTG